MASNQNFVDFVMDQIQGAGEITVRKMFGEYAIYSDGKIFGLICDNQLFIKPTTAGRKFIGEPLEAPPYPGAKNSFFNFGSIRKQSMAERVNQNIAAGTSHAKNEIKEFGEQKA